MHPQFHTVAIVGCGAMGRGIAQIAAQAGSQVLLVDNQPEAAERAKADLFLVWERLEAKGRLDAPQLTQLRSRLSCARLDSLGHCDLVVEAIVERLDAKIALFKTLETIVGAATVLATNTSSLSVTAIAAGASHPQRVAGLHFFNPVPLMKVVEVIAGLRTAPAVCAALTTYARQMGHLPVRAADTPGFIVNHAGRGYGTEALRIVNEGVCDFATVDRILNEQLNAILHHPELQKLEASWRGLRMLVDGVDREDNRQIRVRVLNITWKEIQKDFENANEFDNSQLFRKIRG